MRFAAIVLVAASMASAGAASAATSGIKTDMDYLRASRCRGLAAGLGADTAGIDAALKAAGSTRAPVILDRSQNEMDRGKRDARKGNRESAVAELAGPCAAYTGTPNTNLAGR